MGNDTKFQESWKKKYDCVRNSTKSVYAAVRLACNGKELNIKAGAPTLDRHGSTELHDSNYKKWKTQSLFVVVDNHAAISIPTKPGSTKVLTTEEEAMMAEIIRCLDIVHHNLPFSAADGDSSKFRYLFPDSQIAKNYAQSYTKAKYMIQFSIAPVIEEQILDDLKKKPFTFRFDETTRSQIKKQYDGYATFFSDKFKRVVTTYLGTLFVGKCTADDLYKDLNVLMKQKGLDINDIIGIGMDGPTYCSLK